MSINRLRKRKSDFRVGEWIMDSGAFTEISSHGRYRTAPEEYAREIERWKNCGTMLAAVSQDYMCEPHILKITGLTVAEHQRLSVERYDAIQAGTTAYVMPVLQGYAPAEYLAHIEAYGERLKPGMWVGVGSICKRNGDPKAIRAVLTAIKSVRPDLKLHGFGLKTTALADKAVHAMLHTADSMAWSFAARRQGRDANSWLEADAFERKIKGLHGAVIEQMEMAM